MSDGAAHRRWMLQIAYLALGLLVIFVQLLPLTSMPSRWAGPDMFTVLTMVWMLRRPDAVPLVLVAMLGLIADLLFQRPPGLWAAILVGLSDFLRRREEGLRDAPFPVEWGVVALAYVVGNILFRLIQTLFLLPNAPLGLTVTQMIMTIAAYPPSVLALNYLLGLRRAAPGEVDALGHKR